MVLDWKSIGFVSRVFLSGIVGSVSKRNLFIKTLAEQCEEFGDNYNAELRSRLSYSSAFIEASKKSEIAIKNELKNSPAFVNVMAGSFFSMAKFFGSLPYGMCDLAEQLSDGFKKGPAVFAVKTISIGADIVKGTVNVVSSNYDMVSSEISSDNTDSFNVASASTEALLSSLFLFLAGRSLTKISGGGSGIIPNNSMGGVVVSPFDLASAGVAISTRVSTVPAISFNPSYVLFFASSSSSSKSSGEVVRDDSNTGVKKTGRKPKFNDDEIYTALQKSGGNRSLAAIELSMGEKSITAGSLDVRIQNSPKGSKLRDFARERTGRKKGSVEFFTDDQILTAIKNAGGNRTLAAKELSKGGHTISAQSLGRRVQNASVKSPLGKYAIQNPGAGTTTKQANALKPKEVYYSPDFKPALAEESRTLSIIRDLEAGMQKTGSNAPAKQVVLETSLPITNLALIDHQIATALIRFGGEIGDVAKHLNVSRADLASYVRKPPLNSKTRTVMRNVRDSGWPPSDFEIQVSIRKCNGNLNLVSRDLSIPLETLQKRIELFDK